MTDMHIKNNKFESFEQTIYQMMTGSLIPGFSIVVSQNDAIIYSKAFGARDFEENLPQTLDSLAGIGSSTKSFTCVAILQLQEQGKLNIHDPVSKYVDFKLVNGETPITLWHLMTHSTGLADLGYAVIAIERSAKTPFTRMPFTTWSDFFDHLNGANEFFVSSVGETMRYNNEGYAVLQAIIDKVSGMKYADYVTKNILEPLDMTRSAFTQEKTAKDTDVAKCYDIEGKLTHHPYDELIYGAGGMLSSANELQNYLSMYLHEGSFEGKQILTKESIKEFLKSQIPCNMVSNYIGGFDKEGYSYGWVLLENYCGHDTICHLGSTGKSGSGLFFIPDLHLSISAVANGGSSELVNLLIPLLMIAALNGKDPFSLVPAFTIEAKLESLTGIYTSYKDVFQAKIYKKGSQLFWEAENTNTLAYPDFMALIPEEGNDNITTLNFYAILGPGARTPVIFSERNGKMSVLFERNLLYKKRDI